MGVEEKYELRQGTMFPLNGVRHAFLHFELMIERHFPPRKDDIIEIASHHLPRKLGCVKKKKTKNNHNFFDLSRDERTYHESVHF